MLTHQESNCVSFIRIKKEGAMISHPFGPWLRAKNNDVSLHFCGSKSISEEFDSSEKWSSSTSGARGCLVKGMAVETVFPTEEHGIMETIKKAVKRDK
ncbi:hypothetical protein PTKIN_Ptkin06aG0135700 [Pterospermum kingtungense]